MKKTIILVLIVLTFVGQAFADEYVVKKENDKYGLVNETTKTLILPYEYEEIVKSIPSSIPHEFYTYKIQKNGKWGLGLFDSRGNKYVTPCEYEDIIPLPDSDLCVRAYKIKKDGKWGLFDSYRKKYVTPCEYEDITCVKGSQNKRIIYKAKKNKFITKYYSLSKPSNMDIDCISKLSNGMKTAGIVSAKTIATPITAVVDVIFFPAEFFCGYFCVTRDLWAH